MFLEVETNIRIKLTSQGPDVKVKVREKRQRGEEIDLVSAEGLVITWSYCSKVCE